MKRPVWRYAQEATTNAPFEVVRAKLVSLEEALPLSVFAPRLGGRGPRAWRQASFEAAAEIEGGIARSWTATLGGITEEASISIHRTDAGCMVRTAGKLKGWPLLWKIGLLGWRSEGLLIRFIRSL